MEPVEEMLKRMQLSAAESKSIKIGSMGTARAKPHQEQAVGKVLADKLVNAEGLGQALGRIWCPIKGVGCKDLGENHFLFTFHQAAGKRRALEDGPWMSGKDLVVMADYDGSKTVEEMEFNFIPIWVRVFKLPLGLMHRAMGEAIGGEVGEFMEMDKEEDDTTVGRFLRIKVKLDIRKPLMRGVTVQVEKEDGGERPVWCPLVYEYLPDFCYTCGLIGHTDKQCEKKLGKGEVQQFSKALRFLPDKRRFEESVGDRFASSHLPWRVGGSGSRGSWSSGSRGWQAGKGSDAPSWRKSDEREGKVAGEEAEVTSPEKKSDGVQRGESARRAILLDKQTEQTLAVANEGGEIVAGKEDGRVKENDVNSTLQPMHVERVVEGEGGSKKAVQKEMTRRKGTYKKVHRETGDRRTIGEVKATAGKRVAEEELRKEVEMEEGSEREEEVVGNKKAKIAGLANQSCGSQ
ncbi:unnamed protein product [Urochloa humidicola]